MAFLSASLTSIFCLQFDSIGFFSPDLALLNSSSQSNVNHESSVKQYESRLTVRLRLNLIRRLLKPIFTSFLAFLLLHPPEPNHNHQLRRGKNFAPALDSIVLLSLSPLLLSP
jgi:hypothetical protein